MSVICVTELHRTLCALLLLHPNNYKCLLRLADCCLTLHGVQGQGRGDTNLNVDHLAAGVQNTSLTSDVSNADCDNSYSTTADAASVSRLECANNIASTSLGQTVDSSTHCHWLQQAHYCLARARYVLNSMVHTVPSHVTQRDQKRLDELENRLHSCSTTDFTTALQDVTNNIADNETTVDFLSSSLSDEDKLQVGVELVLSVNYFADKFV